MRFVLFLALLGCNSTSPGQGSYRLMCWLPNGEVFYDGTADGVETIGSGVRFIPDQGPQTGKRIMTTNACTWAKL